MKLFQVVLVFVLLKKSFSSSDSLDKNETKKIKESNKTYEDSLGWLKPVNVSINRRSSHLDQYLKLLEKNNTDGRNISYYRPYWPEGEKYFHLTTRAFGPWKPKQIYNHTIRFKLRTFRPTIFTGPPMQRNSDCTVDCPKIFYYYYGRVCGYRLHTHEAHWRNEFYEFENMCVLERQNLCERDRMWHLLHRGPCPEKRPFKELPTDPKAIIQNARGWQEHIRKTYNETHRSRWTHEPSATG